MAKRQAKTTSREYDSLLNFVEKHRMVLSGKTKPSDNLKLQKLWQEFALEMSSSGLGPPRTGDKWRKIWNEWKVNVRRKTRDVHVAQTQTGGGPNHKTSLTELEERLLSLISTIHLGDTNVPDTFGDIVEVSTGELAFTSQVTQVQQIPLESSVVDFTPQWIIDKPAEETQETDMTLKDLVSPDYKKRKITEIKSTPNQQKRRYTSNVLETATETFKEAQQINSETAQNQVEAIKSLCNVLQERNDIEKERLLLYKEDLKIKRALAKAKYFKVFNTLEGFEDD